MKRISQIILVLTICFQYILVQNSSAQVSEKKYHKYAWRIHQGLETDVNNTKAIEKAVKEILWYGDKEQCVWLADQLMQINASALQFQSAYIYYNWAKSLIKRMMRQYPDFVALADGRLPVYLDYPYFYPEFTINWQVAEILSLLSEIHRFATLKVDGMTPRQCQMVAEQWRVRAHYIEKIIYGDDHYSTQVLGSAMDSAAIYKIAIAIGDSSFIKTPYLLVLSTANLTPLRETAYFSVQREVVKYSFFYLSSIEQDECFGKITMIANAKGKTAESSQINIEELAELYPVTSNGMQGALWAIDMNNQEVVPLLFEYANFRQQLIDKGHYFAKEPPIYSSALYGIDSLFDKYCDLYLRVGYALLQEMNAFGVESYFKSNNQKVQPLLEIMGYTDESIDWRTRFANFVADLLETTMSTYYSTPSSWMISAVILETDILTKMIDGNYADDYLYYELARSLYFFYGVLYNEDYVKYLMDAYLLPALTDINLRYGSGDNCMYMECYAAMLETFHMYDEPERSELQKYYSQKLEKALKYNQCQNSYIINALMNYYLQNRDLKKTLKYLDEYLAMTDDTLSYYGYMFHIYSGSIIEDYDRAAHYLDLGNKEDSSAIASIQYYSGLLPAYVYAKVGQPEKAEQQLKIFSTFIREQFGKQLLTLGSVEANNQLKRYAEVDNCFAQTCHEDVENKPSFVVEFYNWQLFTKGLLLALSNESKTILQNHPSPHVRKLYQTVSELETKLSTIANREALDAQLLQGDIDRARTNLLRMVQSYIDENGTSGVNVTNWTDVRNVLQPNEVAIEFAHGKHNTKDESVKELYIDDEYPTYYALLIRHDSEYPEAIQLFREDSLRALIEGKNEQQIYNDDSTNMAVVHLIVDSLLPYLKPNESVYFSPSGMLHQIAFENMYINDKDLLSNYYSWHRLSSTRQLILRTEKSNLQSADSVMLYGGITYDADTTALALESAHYPAQALAMRSINKDDINRGKAGSLPGTLEEVKAIKRQLDGAHKTSSLLQGAKANEESFKALSDSSFSVLHIATHGFFWEKDSAARYEFFKNGLTEEQALRDIDPMRRCGLLLSGANIALSGKASELPAGVQDGVLTAQEISLLDLSNTKLVILSACETGVGEINGDGVFGLQRAFKKAGVETLIMSLWKVSDVATKMLMTNFYKFWLSGDEIHTAFRKAQQAVREKMDEPTYWAGFIILD